MYFTILQNKNKIKGGAVVQQQQQQRGTTVGFSGTVGGVRVVVVVIILVVCTRWAQHQTTPLLVVVFGYTTGFLRDPPQKTTTLRQSFRKAISSQQQQQQHRMQQPSTIPTFITRKNPVTTTLYGTNEVSEDETTTTNGAEKDFIQQQKQQPDSTYEVIVVGSGIGGLSTAAMLSLYGYKVCVLEAHNRPGGAAHGFHMKVPAIKDGGTFQFDTGPSFFSGLNPNVTPAYKTSNPLRTIFDALNVTVPCIPYRSFGLKVPDGDFIHTPDFFQNIILVEQQQQQKGEEKNPQSQWEQIQQLMKPLARTVSALPTAALRFDIGGILSIGPFLPGVVTPGSNLFNNLHLTQPFQNILNKAGIQPNSFVQNWFDLLCFCLSGLPASGTITAEMAMMLHEFYEPDAMMDCPVGGAQTIVHTLCDGLRKHGGQLFLNTQVDEIVIMDDDNNKQNKKKVVTGVRLKNGRMIHATKAVVSNVSIWDLLREGGLVQKKHFPESFVEERLSTPVGKSFMHLHVGFRITKQELQNLQAHYMYVDNWLKGVDAEDNAVLLSIPSVHDDTLAPEGYGVLHIYTPATEDYTKWTHTDTNTNNVVPLSRTSDEYKKLKVERSEYLWNVLEKFIPDIRDRAVVTKVGTPLTHQRFLRRYRGSYGPAIIAGDGPAFPFPSTPIQGLLLCGDSCFPGIGVPAVAGSGLLAAHSVDLKSLRPQLKLLKRLREQENKINK